jgi:hypothetical protein
MKEKRRKKNAILGFCYLRVSSCCGSGTRRRRHEAPLAPTPGAIGTLRQWAASSGDPPSTLVTPPPRHQRVTGHRFAEKNLRVTLI